MKRINRIVFINLLGLIFWTIPFQTTAQIPFDPEDNFYEITPYWDSYYDSIADVMGPENMGGTGYKHYMHWKSKWEPRVYPSGDFLLYLQALETSFECFEDLGYFDENGSWDEIGPTTSSDPNCNADDVGRLATIAIDPLNDSIILAGSPVGGLYYTTDYGDHWINGGLDRPKEDHGLNMFTPGIASIVILHDAGTTWWYVATGDKDNNFRRSRGVLRSNDMGITWQQVNIGLDIGIWNFIRKIIVHPDYPNYIFAATTKGIYRTGDALETDPGIVEWTRVLEDEPDVSNTSKIGFFDIEFSHTSPRKIIATKEYMMGKNEYYDGDDGSEIWWTSNLYGDIDTWSKMPYISVILPPIGTQFRRFKIMVETSPADPDILYAYVLGSNPDDYHNFYKYSFNSEQWIYINNTNGSTNYGRTAFAVSPTDANVLYYGFVRPYYSNDGGLNWTIHWHDEDINGEDKNFPHSDIHEIKFNSDGSSVWAATDGGPFVSEVGNGNEWENKVNDIGIAIVHYFDQSKIDPDYYLFGGYDAHSQLKGPNHDYWDNIGAGDGYGCAFDNVDLGTFYATNQYIVYRYIDWELDASLYPPDNGFWDRHVTINPMDNHTIYTSSGDEIFRSFDQGSSWQIIANDDIAPPITQTFYDMHVAEGDGKYLYLRVVGAEAPGDEDGHARVYKTTNADVAPADIEWELITPDPGIKAWLQDIEVDYENPDKIWVCYSSSSGQKIFKFENSQWDDITHNLEGCNTGIYSLAHLHGTENGIYAGGYHGIFYLENGSSEWELYKPGIPNTGKDNLKINYCSGKIVSGTYGRGIWETDLPPGWDDAPVITSDETWEGYRVIHNPVYVPSGTTLTITGKVAFTTNGKIIVETGGQLVIDGGLLTNTCGDIWQGIEVWGDPSSPFPDDQGELIVKNESVIENAEVAIRNHKSNAIPPADGGPPPPTEYQGGITKAYNSIFRNNIKTVDLRSYAYKSHNYFRDCEFVYDENYPGNWEPDYFFETRNMTGVSIVSCDFTNATSTVFMGKGIYSYHSQIHVYAKCTSAISPCNEWKNSVFTNLEYGIYASTAYSTRYIKVEHADFINNFRGMYISGMSNAEITDNNFDLCTIYQPNGGYGLYLDNSTAYKVEENNFYNPPAGMIGVGLIVNGSGGDPNEIYRNYFSYLECGIDIQGENRHQDGSGLVLKCNQYDNSMMDKIITWDIPISTPEAGIASNQGSSSSNPVDMAGNLFCVSGPIFNDYDDILNEANSIVYYYPENNDDDRVIPVDYTDNVTLVPQNILPDEWTYEDGCPPSDDAGGGGIGVIKGKMANAGQKIDSTENLLTMLIDGGNTEAVQTDVDNSIPPETMQVYNDLMGKSPYLSDTVVSTAIEKEDVLPGAMIRDIMVANPKAAKSDKLMGKLDERWDPLPEYMKGQILAGRSVVSIREETESRLAAFKLEKAKCFNDLVRYYINDTINPVASTDSLMTLLQNENSLSAKYSLAFISGEYGAWGEGLAVLNDIPVQFELSEKETAEHSQMLDYYNLLLNLAQEGKSVLQADSGQIATLSVIEASINGIASVYARNILFALNQTEYDEPIILPDMMKSSAATEEYNYLLGKANDAPGYIKVQPNPAKDYVIIEYELEQEVSFNIEIFDISGNLKYSDNFTNLQDQCTVDTRKWKAGIYIATLKINGKLIESIKFTIID